MPPTVDKRKGSDGISSKFDTKRARTDTSSDLPEVLELLNKQGFVFKSLEAVVWHISSEGLADLLGYVFTIVYGNAEWRKVLDPKFFDKTIRLNIVQAGGELPQILEKCIRERAWADLQLLFSETAGLRLPKSSPQPPHLLMDLEDNSALQSWQSLYVGENWKLIEEKANKIYRNRKDQRYYAPMFTLMQSSGMGKSRMIDEYSKYHVVIPMCLRDSTAGFPPSDSEVTSYLTEPRSRVDSLSHIYAFFFALFTIAEEDLSKIIKELGTKAQGLRAELAGRFRELMLNQESRDIFYQRVVESAREALRSVSEEQLLKKEKDTIRDGTPTYPSPLQPINAESQGSPTKKVDISGKPLREIAARLTNLVEGFTEDSGEFPAILLSIDEAHSLASAGWGGWNAFLSVRHALRSIREQPIVSVLLSTSNKLHAFVPSRKADPSFRIHEGSFRDFPPVCAIGYDIFTQGFIGSKDYKITDYASVENMARFGRPLFYQMYKHDKREELLWKYVMSKIIDDNVEKAVDGSSDLPISAILAILALRLPLEFNTSTPRGVEESFDQVHKHMRLCLYADEDLTTLQTAQPAEPILAEAAFKIVRNKQINQARQLVEVLEGPGINKGDRGELIGMLLLLLARDRAVPTKGPPIIKLVDLIKNLLKEQWWSDVLDAKPFASKPGEEDISFQKMFKDACVYLVQFIKVYDPLVMSDLKYLMAAAARGTAILCNDNAKGIDLVVPVVLDSTKPVTPNNISAILIQIKNDRRFQTANSGYRLFNNMNPLDEHYGPFNDENTEYPPLIRMVFSLASNIPAVSSVQCPTQNPPQAKGAPTLTIYDIWCAGASSKTFQVIHPNDDKIYDKLLKLNKSPFFNENEWTTPMEEELNLSMCPLAFPDLACFTALSGRFRQTTTEDMD